MVLGFLSGFIWARSYHKLCVWYHEVLVFICVLDEIDVKIEDELTILKQSQYSVNMLIRSVLQYLAMFDFVNPYMSFFLKSAPLTIVNQNHLLVKN